MEKNNDLHHHLRKERGKLNGITALAFLSIKHSGHFWVTPSPIISTL